MIPLGDASRRPLSFPVVTAGLITINCFVFRPRVDRWRRFRLRVFRGATDVVSRQHLYTVFTSMFMHARWERIIGNMVFLWAFGPEKEDAMGHRRYLVFYLLGGLVSALAEIVADPTSTVTSLGARGAIAAVMGAFVIFRTR
jgi:membrane associated rhomboid family serine protease